MLDNGAPTLVAGLSGLEMEVSATNAIRSRFAGGGYEVATALAALGERVRLLTAVGRDDLGEALRSNLESAGVDTSFVLHAVESTPQALILRDERGRVRVTRDLGGLDRWVPAEHRVRDALRGCRFVVLLDLDMPFASSPALCAPACPMAVNLDSVSDLDSPLVRRIVELSEVVFITEQSLTETPEEWVRRLRAASGPKLAIVGLGRRGALIWVRADDFIERLAVGQASDPSEEAAAGTTLFAAFVQGYSREPEPYRALEAALRVASPDATTTSPAMPATPAPRRPE